MKPKKKINLLHNSRFYILSSSIVFSFLILCLLRTVIPNDTLWYIRTEQVFGVLALLFWYITLIISPLGKVIGPQKWFPGLVFARRALGVSAAYFALMHALFALFGQLGGIKGVFLLPGLSTWSLIFGVFALVVLLFMAALSIDGVVSFFKFKQWKWLGRIGFIAGTAAILHVWLVGTHIADGMTQLVAFQMLAILFGLEATRLGTSLGKKPGWIGKYAVVVAVSLWIVLTGGLIIVKAFVPSYSTEHQSAGPEGSTHAH